MVLIFMVFVNKQCNTVLKYDQRYLLQRRDVIKMFSHLGCTFVLINIHKQVALKLFRKKADNYSCNKSNSNVHKQTRVVHDVLGCSTNILRHSSWVKKMQFQVQFFLLLRFSFKTNMKQEGKWSIVKTGLSFRSLTSQKGILL